MKNLLGDEMEAEYDLDFSKAKPNRFAQAEARPVFENLSVAHDPSVYATGGRGLGYPSIVASESLGLKIEVKEWGVLGNTEVFNLGDKPMLHSD